jgi:type II secretory pathway pseudopilin PulG
MTYGLRRVHAFSLVELTLSLGIAAFCLIAVFGLMPVSVQTNRNSTSQSAAVNIMAAVVADLRAASRLYDNSKTYSAGDQVFLSGNCYEAIRPTTGNQPPNPTYWTSGSPCPQFGISFPTTFPTTRTLYFDNAGQFLTSPGADSRYRLDVTFLPWTSGNGCGAATTCLYGANLKVTWPASADPATPSGSAEMFAAFDRN